MGARHIKPEMLDYKKIEAFAARGLTQDQIAQALGICHSSFYKLKKNDKQFREAVERGMAKGVAEIANQLFKKAQSGDLGAICFFLKTKGGFREDKVVVNVSQSATQTIDAGATLTDKQREELEKALDEVY
jgi:hypothetical protein|nr:MAG TPA: terminase small subunit [Caudoviricetes sp.]